ncbi:hypothetical protein GCM10010228_46230 [Streptomyces massasporeus]|nr:hypothetical protein GCM10010228_46230 [Streptomyces massasporeus]
MTRVATSSQRLRPDSSSRSRPSRTRRTTGSKRAAGYAQAGVPLYLLIDGWAPGGPTITLYGEPQRDVYRVLDAGKFGELITLPEPFGLDLDTGEFAEK